MKKKMGLAACLLAGLVIAGTSLGGGDVEWQFSDSSHTVRANMERWTWDCTGTGDEATVLPTLSALASTWNRDLAAAHGHVIGAEARARGKDQMLGPGVNIMRDPRVPCPVKELKDFAKVALAPGETKRVTLTVTARDLA